MQAENRSTNSRHVSPQSIDATTTTPLSERNLSIHTHNQMKDGKKDTLDQGAKEMSVASALEPSDLSPEKHQWSMPRWNP